MIPEALRRQLEALVKETDHPRECVVDVMYALQRHYGHLTDEAVHEAAFLVGMTALEVDELATFYDFIYREPVGKYVIHVCDSVICWMHGHETLVDHLCAKLGVSLGGTTQDGLFTLLPVCCIGFCDQAPVMLINGKPYGRLTVEKIDAILQRLREDQPPLVEVR